MLTLRRHREHLHNNEPVPTDLMMAVVKMIAEGGLKESKINPGMGDWLPTPYFPSS